MVISDSPFLIEIRFEAEVLNNMYKDKNRIVVYLRTSQFQMDRFSTPVKEKEEMEYCEIPHFSIKTTNSN